MALMDLSKFDIQANPLAQDKQVFSEEGAGAYKALASLGGEVAKVSTEMYLHHRDVVTDTASTAALDDASLELAHIKATAQSNIDPKTDFVAGTNLTFDSYIAQQSDEVRQRYSDKQDDSLVKEKFDKKISSHVGDLKRQAVFESAKFTKENTLQRSNEFASSQSDLLLDSPIGQVNKDLNSAFKEMNRHYTAISKTSGVDTANEAKIKYTQSLMNTAANTLLRNAGTGDQKAADELGQFLGVEFIPKESIDATGNKHKTWELVKRAGDESGSGNPMLDYVSAEKKAGWMNQMLSIKNAVTKVKGDKIEAKIKDWKAGGKEITGSNIDEWIRIGQEHLRSPDYKGGNADKVRDSMDGSLGAFVYKVKQSMLDNGGKLSTEFIQEQIKSNRLLARGILTEKGQNGEPPILSPEEYDSMIKNDFTLGAESKVKYEEILKTEEENYRIAADTHPESLISSDKELSDLRGMAFVTDSKGNVKANADGLLQYANRYSALHEKIGTVLSQKLGQNLMPVAEFNAFMDGMDTGSANDRLENFKIINSVPDLRTRFYAQAIAQHRMTEKEVGAAIGSTLGQSRAADLVETDALKMQSPQTKKAYEEAFKQKTTEGMFGRNKDSEWISEKISSSIAGNQFLADAKAVARKSGMDNAVIQAMFQEDKIRDAVKVRVLTNLQEEQGFFGASGKIEEITNKAIEEYISTKVTPLTSDSLNILFKKDLISEKGQEKAKETASQLKELVKDGLENGTLKISPEDYSQMTQGKKYANLSPELRQRLWMNDVMDEISFNGSDGTGMTPNLIAGFSDKNTGTQYRIKLVKEDGTSFVPTAGDVRDFANMSANALYTKMFGGGFRTKQLGDIPSRFSAKTTVLPTRPTRRELMSPAPTEPTYQDGVTARNTSIDKVFDGMISPSNDSVTVDPSTLDFIKKLELSPSDYKMYKKNPNMMVPGGEVDQYGVMNYAGGLTGNYAPKQGETVDQAYARAALGNSKWLRENLTNKKLGVNKMQALAAFQFRNGEGRNKSNTEKLVKLINDGASDTEVKNWLLRPRLAYSGGKWGYGVFNRMVTLAEKYTGKKLSADEKAEYLISYHEAGEMTKPELRRVLSKVRGK